MVNPLFYSPNLNLSISSNLFNNTSTDLVNKNVDVVVSDLATYVYNDSRYDSLLYKEGVNYFPYLLIEKYLEFGDDETLYFLKEPLNDNSFFIMR